MRTSEGIISSRGRALTLGVVACALSLLSAAEANADTKYFVAESEGDGWSIGNDNFHAGVTLSGLQWAKGWIQNGTVRAYETKSQGTFGALASVFDKDGQLIWVTTSGLAESARGVYASVGGGINVMGSRIWTADPEANAGCEPSEVADTACAIYEKDISKTFFTAAAQFSVAFVPVTVTASVKGGIRGRVSSRSVAMHGTSNQRKHHLGIVGLSAGSGAYATATMRALAGIEDVLAVGVTSSFALIDASATADVNTVHRNDAASKSFGVDYNLGFDIRSMSGTVDVWAHITPIYKPSTNLITVAGFNKYIPIADAYVSRELPSLDP